jgi:hypothetical protein
MVVGVTTQFESTLLLYEYGVRTTHSELSAIQSQASNQPMLSNGRVNSIL